MQPSDAGIARYDAYSQAFSSCLLDPRRSPPPDVQAPGGKDVERRFNIYRNNVVVSLIEALAAVFPATQRITGPDFFRAMARFHIRETPPASPLLFEYGREFPDFIAQYEYARSMPWLADVARIERAWLDAYHAADEAVLAAEALTLPAPAGIGDLRFVAHPATRLLRSQYPAFTIFSANKSDDPVGPITATEPEWTLITRPALDVEVRKLSRGAALMLARLIAGGTLAEAAGDAFAACPDFDLASAISGIIEVGAFSDVSTRGVGK